MGERAIVATPVCGQPYAPSTGSMLTSTTLPPASLAPGTHIVRPAVELSGIEIRTATGPRSLGAYDAASVAGAPFPPVAE